MVTRARSWIDDNKGFVLSVLVIICTGVLGYGDLQGDVKTALAQGGTNKGGLVEVKKELKAHCKEAGDLDHDQTTQLVLINNEISHIHEAIKSNRAALEQARDTQKEMNRKLDRLLSK